MLKTQIETGLKYLCYTTKKDPFGYKGSGKRWKNHLKVHGANIHTEILGIFDTEIELKKKGVYYSKLWQVVDSDEFANLRPEEGDGGDTSKFIDYKNMKPMPSGKWKRKDLTEYNKTRINPGINELTCPWCGEKGYGPEFRKKHLVTTRKTETDKMYFNCPKNTNKKYHPNQKFYEINGKKMTTKEICDKYNLTRNAFENRKGYGWNISKIISTPLKKNKNTKK